MNYVWFKVLTGDFFRCKVVAVANKHRTGDRRMPKLLSNLEVQELLGVSHLTVERMRRYKELPLPFGRVGRQYFYDESKVLAWVEENGPLDPDRAVRSKFDHERRPVTTVAGTSTSEGSA